MKIDIFGRIVEVLREQGIWVAYTHCGEGKRIRDFVFGILFRLPKKLAEPMGRVSNLLAKYSRLPKD